MVGRARVRISTWLPQVKLLRHINEADPDDARGILRLHDYFYYKVRACMAGPCSPHAGCFHTLIMSACVYVEVEYIHTAGHGGAAGVPTALPPCLAT